jgi:NAD(P)-dependent dehydrogenase (short-subunit alcohol dehydrogenase family)
LHTTTLVVRVPRNAWHSAVSSGRLAGHRPIARSPSHTSARGTTPSPAINCHQPCRWFDNAGVGGPTGPLWLVGAGDWEWVLGVNLGGVINGIRAFVPLLLEQEDAHIVNTASIFGVFAGALGPYGISKHAIVALSETLHFQLRALGSRVGVSVLCPGAVRTNFGTSARNRPAKAGPTLAPGEAERASAERFRELALTGREPSEVAGMVVEAIRAGRFYILTSANRNEAVRRRAEEILAGIPPAPPFP